MIRIDLHIQQRSNFFFNSRFKVGRIHRGPQVYQLSHSAYYLTLLKPGKQGSHQSQYQQQPLILSAINPTIQFIKFFPARVSSGSLVEHMQCAASYPSQPRKTQFFRFRQRFRFQQRRWGEILCLKMNFVTQISQWQMFTFCLEDKRKKIQSLSCLVNWGIFMISKNLAAFISYRMEDGHYCD